ncbi:hypothetical protein HK103_001782, partial [Boothiomyces macroporosus]
VSVKDQVCGENNTNSENDHIFQNVNTEELSKVDSGVNEISEESFEFIQKGTPFSGSFNSNITTSPKEYGEVLLERINELQKKESNWCKSEGNMFSLNNSIKSNQVKATSIQRGNFNSLKSLESLVGDHNLKNDFEHQYSITLESKEISNLHNTSYIRHEQNSVSLGESYNPILSLESESEMPKLISHECVHEKTDELVYLKDKWFVQSTSVGSQTITDGPAPKILSTGVVLSESPESIVKNSVISEVVYPKSSSRKEALKLLRSKIIQLAHLSQFGRQDVIVKLEQINIQSIDTLDSLLEKITSVVEVLFEYLGKNLNDIPACTKSPPYKLQERLKVLELTLLNHELVLVIQKLLCNTIGSSFYLQTDRNVEISE